MVRKRLKENGREKGSVPVSAFPYHELKVLLPKIEDRLGEFASVPKKRWARELVFCMLTPQSSAYHAEGCLCELENNGLFRGDLSEREVASILRNPKRYVRFHNQKAKRIVHNLKILPEVIDRLSAGNTPHDEREYLLATINGFGLKESSHALRNIGRKNLAILDRHILRNLHRYGALDSPSTSLSVKTYLEVEARFVEFAEQIGSSIDELDLFFWASEAGSIFK